MTVETFEQPDNFVLQSIGPHPLDFSYGDAGEVLVYARDEDGTYLLVDPSQYVVDPLTNANAGNLTFEEDFFDLQQGTTIVLRRKTQIEQGWAGQGSAREVGLERQLDAMTRMLQEQAAFLDQVLAAPFDYQGPAFRLPLPVDGEYLMGDGEGWATGLPLPLTVRDFTALIAERTVEIDTIQSEVQAIAQSALNAEAGALGYSTVAQQHSGTANTAALNAGLDAQASSIQRAAAVVAAEQAAADRAATGVAALAADSNRQLAQTAAGAASVDRDAAALGSEAAALVATNSSLVSVAARDQANLEAATAATKASEALASALIAQTAQQNVDQSLSSLIALRVKSGTANAIVELVAASAPGGAAYSGVKIAADLIEFIGLASFGGAGLQTANYEVGEAGARIAQNFVEFNSDVIFNGRIIDKDNLKRDAVRVTRRIYDNLWTGVKGLVNGDYVLVGQTDVFPAGTFESIVQIGQEYLNPIELFMTGRLSVKSDNTSVTFFVEALIGSTWWSVQDINHYHTHIQNISVGSGRAKVLGMQPELWTRIRVRSVVQGGSRNDGETAANGSGLLFTVSQDRAVI